MSPTGKQPDACGVYGEAIGQLLAAAERTHDPQARITLTTLAEMFVRLDQEHQAHDGTGGPVDPQA